MRRDPDLLHNHFLFAPNLDNTRKTPKAAPKGGFRYVGVEGLEPPTLSV